MKKISALLVSFILLFFIFVPCCVAQAYEGEKSLETFDLLEALGIDEGINQSGESNITRAEFTAMVVRAINLSSVENIDGYFEDVSASSPFIKEIYAAKTLGITNGTAVNMFSPDGNVTRNAALKMILVAIGYENMAVTYGGFPLGYNIIEARLDILNGVTSTDYITVADAKRIITNALKEDIAVFSKVEGDILTFKVEEGKNLLTENWHLNAVSGVMTKAGYMTLDTVLKNNNYVTVAGQTFKSEISAEKYFGMTVTAWVGREDDTVRAVEKSKINGEVIIDAKDIYDFRNDTLIVGEVKEEMSYKVSKSLSFIENGKLIPHSRADFLFENGTIRLLDNDGNGVYDYAFAEKVEYFVISAINAANKIIYDKKSPLGFVELEETADKVAFIVDGEGNEVPFAQLKTGSVVGVICSRDTSVCKVIVNAQQSVSGVVEESYEKTVVINGNEYKTNSYFERLGINVVPGKSYTFLVADDNTITAIDTAVTDGVEYGFYLGFARKQGLSKETEIKILTSSNNILVYELADKITLNGTNNVSKTDVRIDNLLVNGIYYNYQLIRYKTDSNGKINMIDTNDKALCEDWEIDTSVDSSDSLTQYLDYKRVNYRGGSAFGAPSFSFKKGNIFVVPTALKTATAPDFYDDIFFSATTYSSLINNRYYDVDIFDFDENYYPKAIVVYEDVTGETVSDEVACHLVHSVSDAINADGEFTKLISTYSEGYYYRYFVDTEKGSGLTLPQPGDVVRFSLNPENEIVNVTVDVKFKKNASVIKDAFEIKYVGDYTDIISYISGHAKSYGDSSLVLRATFSPATLQNIGNIAPLPMSYTPRCVIYDISDESVTVADFTDILTEDVVGADKASHVLCRIKYYAVCDIIIYQP